MILQVSVWPLLSLAPCSWYHCRVGYIVIVDIW